jgi:ABC-type sugar transport system ATPase subunit
LHVTHDFIEAGTLGDLAMVLDGGRLSQVGTPDAIFRKPASAAVADFIGAENVYSGNIARAETANNDDIATLTFFRRWTHTRWRWGSSKAGLGMRSCVVKTSCWRDNVPVPSFRAQRARGSHRRGRAEWSARACHHRRRHVHDGGDRDAGVCDIVGLAAGESVVASIKATAVHLC